MIFFKLAETELFPQLNELKKETVIWRYVSGAKKSSRKGFLMGLVLDFDTNCTCTLIVKLS